MLVIELIYQKSLIEVDKYLEEHRAWLEEAYQQGLLLASGPKQPREGGIIIALMDKETARQWITADPFYQHHLAEYKITEFQAVKYCTELANKVK